MPRNCLIIDSMHESIFDMLSRIGWKYDYHPDIDRPEIKRIISNYQGLIVRSKTLIDGDLLGNVKSLAFVARAGAGLDNVEVDFLVKRNIALIHAAEGNRDAVGEFTVGALLSLLRNIPRADQEVRSLIWKREENRGEEIAGKTIGIIGYGNMGKTVARCLSGFGCKILVYDKYKLLFGDEIVKEVAMQEIFDEADIVSFHIPLTSETRGMVTEAYLNSFKKDIVIVNTARGEILPLKAIESGLRSGKIRGVALDVLENEKLNTLTPEQLQSFNYLKSRSNVIFSPHIAGWTYESHVKINVALVEKIRNLGL